MFEHQARLGGTDEEQPVRLQHSPQRRDRALLRGHIQINQHVAAEDHVVGPDAVQKAGGEDVGSPENDGLAYRFRKAVTLVRRREVARPKVEILAAERVAAVERLTR